LNSGGILWFRNDGGGQFLEQPFVANDLYPLRDIHVADLDGDGAQDLLFAESENGTTVWQRNDGSGVFGPWAVISDAYDSRTVAAADLDGDGDLDILAPHIDASYNAAISTFGNDGNGNFSHLSTPPEPGLCVGAQLIAAGDLDNDGDMDMACGREYCQTQSFSINDGTGIFGTTQMFSNMALDPVSMHVVDLNGDGWNDVLIASESYDQIGYYMNMGIATGLPVSDPPASLKLRVSPNPMVDHARLIADRPLLPDDIITFIDAAGRTVHSAAGNGTAEVVVAATGLSAGLYDIAIIRNGALMGRVPVVVQGQ
jgi:hypothetical protein